MPRVAHRGESGNRAISVTIDVLLALVIISASIMLLAVFLTEEEAEAEDEHDQFEAQQLGQELDRTIVTVDYEEYNLYADEPPWNQQASGNYLHLLMVGTVESIAIDDEPLLTTTLPERIEAKLLNFLTQSETEAYIHSQWLLVPDHLEGGMTVGDPPPPDADVSSTTIQYPVPYGVANESDEQLTAADKEAEIVDYVVEMFYPPDGTQRELENAGRNRERLEYRYKHKTNVLYDQTVNAGARDIVDEEFNRATGTNVNILNEQLESLLLEAIDNEITDEERAELEDHEYNHVEITIETW